MMRDVTDGLWSELNDATPSIDLYRRNLQRAHVELLARRLESTDPASDMPSLARGELEDLLSRCGDALETDPDVTTARHLDDVMARVKLALDDDGQVGGMIQYLPIEHSFAEGRHLHYVACTWVHGHKQGRGNFQKRGMGKAL